MPPRRNSGITFWGMVMGVWTALKLKKAWDEYKPVATDDVEGGVQLPPDTPLPSDDPATSEDAVSLLDTGIRVRREKKKRTGCCMCCGIDCTLFWKAFGIVLALWMLYGAFKFAKWAVTPTPTGLENMPIFSTSLGCEHASFYYDNDPKPFIVKAPIGSIKNDHFFDARGSAVGTVTIAAASSSATEVEYQLTIRASEKSLIDQVILESPGPETDIEHTTYVIVNTPRLTHEDTAGKRCIRYDIKILIPPNLKKIHVSSHTPAQVKFLEGSEINIENLFVTLFDSGEKNMILPQETVRASEELGLEINRGWVVGDASISKLTSITTQNGDGVANVRVHPAPPSEDTEPEAAVLRTTTGAGRTDIFYMTNKAYKRPIDSTHISSRNGDVYLTYKEAEFNGKIAMDSKSYSMTGAKRFDLDGAPPNPDQEVKWTNYVGDANGGDKIVVDSRAWTGLYF